MVEEQLLSSSWWWWWWRTGLEVLDTIICYKVLRWPLVQLLEQRSEPNSVKIFAFDFDFDEITSTYGCGAHHHQAKCKYEFGHFDASQKTDTELYRKTAALLY